MSKEEIITNADATAVKDDDVKNVAGGFPDTPDYPCPKCGKYDWTITEYAMYKCRNCGYIVK